MEISEAIIVDATKIKPEKMQFLWPDRIPLNCVTTYYGMPEQGKSTQALDVAARISTGAEWPDSIAKAPKGSTLLIAQEDAVREVTWWRYAALGGDFSKLYILKGIKKPNQNSLDWFDMAKDLSAVEEKIKTIDDLKLIIIDPISAYFGNTDTYRNSTVRRVLGPLSTLAQTHEIAILLIHHVNKNTQQHILHRMSGSTAFGEFTRQAWLFGATKEDETQKLMLSAKKSYGPPTTGLAFRVEQTDPANINSIKLVYENTSMEESAQEYFSKNKTYDILISPLQAMIDKWCEVSNEPSEATKYQTIREHLFELHKIWFGKNNLEPLSKAAFGMKFHYLIKRSELPIQKKQVMRQGERICFYEGIEILSEIRRKYLGGFNVKNNS